VQIPKIARGQREKRKRGRGGETQQQRKRKGKKKKRRKITAGIVLLFGIFNSCPLPSCGAEERRNEGKKKKSCEGGKKRKKKKNQIRPARDIFPPLVLVEFSPIGF